MKFRILGLVPALALAAMNLAQAQSTGGGGQMAYPDSLPSGQVRIPAPTGRDTGSMSYPTSPGGVAQPAARGRDTGSMAYPGGRSPLSTAAAPVVNPGPSSTASPLDTQAVTAPPATPPRRARRPVRRARAPRPAAAAPAAQ